MKKQILALTIMICCSCKAQQKKQDTICYQKARGFIENRLPNDICIEKDELIYTLFDKFDFNSDGLQDIAVKIGKKKRKNGDSRKFSIYQKVNDSTYTKFRVLNNIYPLWFEDYRSSVKLEDPNLNALKQQYEMGNPLQQVKLIENKIVLNLNADVGYKYVLTFTFSSEKQDWLLTEYLEYDTFNDTKTPYPNEKLNTSISEFSYFGFLNGEY